MPDGLEGGCACGQMRYRLLSKPIFVHCCHCKDCQRQCGTAFALNAIIETDRVALLQGETRAFPMPTDSGQAHEIVRCAVCGTAVWSHYAGMQPFSFIRVGTLDDPPATPPDVHIYTRSKLPWVRLPDGVPAFDAYYRARDVWPAESLERRRLALGRS
ncbi:MAG: GFA family protein [Acetobacteraceae bacterium]